MSAWERLGVIAYWLSWPALRLYVPFRKTTRVLVMSGNDVLLVKGWLGNGKWRLPGGGIRRRESAADAASRELREELGFEIVPNDMASLGEFTYKEDGLPFSAHVFSVVVSDRIPVSPNHEITSSAWRHKSHITNDEDVSSSTGKIIRGYRKILTNNATS